MGEPATEGTVHFIVGGAWLTNLVRQLWADEGEPEKALRILEAAFPAMPEADMLAIMIGEKKLIGDSDRCGLADDDAKESKHGNPLSVLSVVQRFRAESEDRNDWLEMAVDRTTKIASPKGLVAIPVRRLKAYRKGEVTLEDIPYRKIETFSISPEDVERDDGTPIPEPEPRPQPKPKRVIDQDNGWLSPEGKFYSCAYSGHIQLADDLGFEEWRLEELQWVKITEGDSFAPASGHPSQSQRDLLFDWYRARKKELPYWLEDLEKDDDQGS